MTKLRVIPSLFLAVGLSVAVAACGVEADGDAGSAAGGAGSTTEQAPSSTTEPVDETTTEPDDPSETTEPTGTTTPGRTTPSVSLPAGMEDTFQQQLAAGFEMAGLSEEQATCLAEAYVAEFGTDVGAATEPSAMLDLFTDCDISPSDLGRIGGGGGTGGG